VELCRTPAVHDAQLAKALALLRVVAGYDAHLQGDISQFSRVWTHQVSSRSTAYTHKQVTCTEHDESGDYTFGGRTSWMSGNHWQ
jgi:hypothetical protein